MKVHAAFALLPFVSIITISPTSAALRGNGRRNTFDGTDNDNGNGQGNGNDKSYAAMVIDTQMSLENGQSLDETRVKQLKQKFKQEKLKVDDKESKSGKDKQSKSGKKEMFKEAAVTVFERNKNKGENITEYALLMETISEITDQELQFDLRSNIEDGYAEPEDLDTVEYRAGEFEEMEDELDEMEEPEDEYNKNGRHLGVPAYNNKWANGVVRYKVVLDESFAGYWMWLRRVLPAIVEVESETILQFEFSGYVWSSADEQSDGTVYLRATDSGCSATVGAPFRGSSRIHGISIGPNCSHGSIMHELLHAAGMLHQQSGSYRSRYVTVNYDNIQPNRENNFRTAENHGYEFVYDYGSIMHYGEYAFSKNNRKTIDCRGHGCGQRASLSYYDSWEIIIYYWGYYFVNGNL